MLLSAYIADLQLWVDSGRLAGAETPGSSNGRCPNDAQVNDASDSMHFSIHVQDLVHLFLMTYLSDTAVALAT